MTRVPQPAVPVWKPTPEAELADLRFVWRQYDIQVEDGTWSARFPGAGEALTAESAFFLRQLLRDDHRERRFA